MSAYKPVPPEKHWPTALETAVYIAVSAIVTAVAALTQCN